jgi:hypothetical protein
MARTILASAAPRSRFDGLVQFLDLRFDLE